MASTINPMTGKVINVPTFGMPSIYDSLPSKTLASVLGKELPPMTPTVFNPTSPLGYPTVAPSPVSVLPTPPPHVHLPVTPSIYNPTTPFTTPFVPSTVTPTPFVNVPCLTPVTDAFGRCTVVPTINTTLPYIPYVPTTTTTPTTLPPFYPPTSFNVPMPSPIFFPPTPRTFNPIEVAAFERFLATCPPAIRNELIEKERFLASCPPAIRNELLLREELENNCSISSRRSLVDAEYSNLCNVAFRPSHPIELYSLTNPIRVTDREGNRMLWLCYDLKGFKPEEITVTLNKTERAIVVEAGHDSKDAKEHHVSRKLVRKFILPESLAKIDLTKIELKSCLNFEGLLTVECVLPKLTSDEIAKCPITSKAVYTPYGFDARFACPTTCSVKPVACKIN